MAVPGGASPGQPDPSSGGIRFTIGITVETAEPLGAYWPKRYAKLAPALPKELVDAEFFVAGPPIFCDPDGNFFEIV